jgi:hypothetical protein
VTVLFTTKFSDNPYVSTQVGSPTTMNPRGDLESHFYDYVWLKKRVAELKDEKTKLNNTDALTFKKELLYPFVQSSSMARPNSNPVHPNVIRYLSLNYKQ